MGTSDKYGSEQVSPKSSIFRIFDLPRELQDGIYELSFEQRVEFLFTTLDNLDSRFSLPNLTSVNPEGCKTGNQQQLEASGTSAEADSVLTFMIGFSTPLLLVSKRVNADVRTLIGLRRKQYHNVLKSTIYRDHLVNPSSLFMEICSQSRFNFAATRSHARTFWRSVLPQIQPCPQNMVIRQEVSRSTVEERMPVFTHLLSQHFPGLRTVSFEVPYSLEQSVRQLQGSQRELRPRQNAYYQNDQLVLACGMLALEKIDAVLVFYQNDRKDVRVHLHYLIRYLEDELLTGFTFSFQKNFEFFDEFPDNVYRRNGITRFSSLPDSLKIIRRKVPKQEYTWVQDEIQLTSEIPSSSINNALPGY